jgi:hypothetical protein
MIELNIAYIKIFFQIFLKLRMPFSIFFLKK